MDITDSLERTSAIRRAVTSWAIIAFAGCAEVRAAARAVAARFDIVQAAGVGVDVRRIVDAAGVTGQSVDASDDGRGYARTTKDQPAWLLVGVVDGDAGRGIGHG